MENRNKAFQLAANVSSKTQVDLKWRVVVRTQITLTGIKAEFFAEIGVHSELNHKEKTFGRQSHTLQVLFENVVISIGIIMSKNAV